MGKKGDALRAAKAQRATYTFTAAQLEAHDKEVRMRTLERKKDELKAYAREVLDKDFEERQKLLTGDATDVTINVFSMTIKVFSMLISISCKVLVEHFGWKPIWKHSTSRNRLSRFVLAVQQETEALLNDELLDIRSYAKQAYDVTGVMFEAGEEEEDGETT